MNFIEKLIGISATTLLITAVSYVFNEVYSLGLTGNESVIAGIIVGFVLSLLIISET